MEGGPALICLVPEFNGGRGSANRSNEAEIQENMAWGVSSAGGDTCGQAEVEAHRRAAQDEVAGWLLGELLSHQDL